MTSAKISTKSSKGLTRFALQELLVPIALLLLVSWFFATRSPDLLLNIQQTLCLFVMVLALQIFVGNSGVLSFGHGAFAMIGAFAAGLATAPQRIKAHALALQNLLPFLVNFHLGFYVSLLFAAIMGGLVAGITGTFLMRLNGLAAGIATFALLGVSYDFFFNNIHVGPGSQALPRVPNFAHFWEPLALAVGVMVIVYLFNISPWGRMLRATREDNLAAPATGISILKVRWIAFTISGAIAGLAGGMLTHVVGTLQVQDYYLPFTFSTLAMLIIGGSGSLWGALLGTLIFDAIGQILLYIEQGKAIVGLTIHLPIGARALIVSASLIVMLLWRTSGITRGREFALNFRRTK